MKHIKYSLAILLALMLTGCDDMLPEEELDFFEENGLLHEKKPAVEITNIDFTKDNKKFTVSTRMLRDIGPYQLADSEEVRIQVRETVNGIQRSRMMPVLTAARNTEAHEITASGIKMLVLIDLTLPREAINAQRLAVEDMLTSFSPDNLYASFIYGDSITAPVKATDYIMSHYFQRQDADQKLLYRAILQLKSEMQASQQPWNDAQGKLLIVFSDEQVYLNDDQPMDPKHFDLQQEMLRSVGGDVMTFYVSMNSDQEQSDDHPSGILKIFCRNNGGIYQTAFNWMDIKNEFFNRYGMNVSSYEFDFVNPDYKVYRGNNHVMTLNFYSTANDSLVATASKQIHKGSIYEPVIVGGHGFGYVILQGILLGLILLVLTYLILQYLLPFIRYRIFLSRHVITYRGPLMISQGRMIGQSCYLCKAPFMEGDRLVVKCSHTMHKSCWDENDCQCPEYGHQCSEGSHFYNVNRLHDIRNAPYCMPWVLTAILVATLAWTTFMLWAHYSSPQIVESILRSLHLVSESNSKSYVNEFAEHEKQLPAFGLTMGFFLTAGFSVLAMYCRSVRRKWLSVLTRAILAAFVSMMGFVITAAIEAVFDINSFSFLIEWIPWTLTAFIITWAATFRTRITLRKRRLILAAVIALLSMYLWTYCVLDSRLDFRILLLVSCLIFAVGLAACTAKPVSRSKRYFLRTEGPVKTMEIALFKWFDTPSPHSVTLGKSVDCRLQLSWDLTGNVAPLHAELQKKQDAIYLVPVEEGVFANDKALKVGKSYRLYQGESFSIGNTTFTYIEKDIR